jgi:hypothetical protein
MENNPERGSGMNISNLFYEYMASVFWAKILKFFDADPDPGSCQLLDPGSGMEKLDPGSGINIPDPQHCLLVLVPVCRLLSGPVAMSAACS